MKTYAEKKDEYRNRAIDWQLDFENSSYSYAEIADWGEYWEKIGRRFGLLREFRENCIC